MDYPTLYVIQHFCSSPALDMLQRSNTLEPSIHHNGQPGAESFTFFHAEKQHNHIRVLGTENWVSVHEHKLNYFTMAL